MQVVTLNDLKKLVGGEDASSTIDESIFDLFQKNQSLGNGLDFKTLCEKYAAKKEHLEKVFDAKQQTFIRRSLYNYMNDILKDYCPPIRLIGKGSSRTAYACIGGKCLKIAINPAGISQNSHEYKTTTRQPFSHNYSCFVQTYASNGNDFGMIVSECVVPITDSKLLVDAFGLPSINAFYATITAMSKSKHIDMVEAIAMLENIVQDHKTGTKPSEFSTGVINAATGAIQFLQALSKKKASQMNPGEKSLMEIFSFWKKRGVDQLFPGDVKIEENWGFAIRNGKIAPILLDVGMSKQVSDDYYKTIAQS